MAQRFECVSRFLERHAMSAQFLNLAVFQRIRGALFGELERRFKVTGPQPGNGRRKGHYLAEFALD